MKRIKKEMHIKIQKGSPNGVNNNRGSCRNLAEYLTHEDAEREKMGLEILPFITPEGKAISLEDAIQSMDKNGEDLPKNDSKFFHLIAAPSQEEIKAMGENDQIIYRNALYLIKAISRAYAQHFNREGVEDESDLVIYWKPHFTRGEDNILQFHLHAIVSRKTSGKHGPKMKISPLTNHRHDTDGPIRGGFDRNAFAEKCEKIFDRLFSFERQVSKSFGYQNALAHGTVEDKAAQADKLAEETINEMREAIAANTAKTHDVFESTSEIVGLMPQVQQIFRTEKDPLSLHLSLAAIGLTCQLKQSDDGVEDVEFEKGGTTLSFRELLNADEQEVLLDDVTRITGIHNAMKVRDMRARKEAEKKASQRKFGGPKLRR